MGVEDVLVLEPKAHASANLNPADIHAAVPPSAADKVALACEY